jgi:hypothetical protein
MPAKRDPADKLYHNLMKMQQQTFEAGRFQVSYHLLAAAVHAAEELKRVELFDELAELANSRQEDLDRREPTHAISTASAHGRGNSALFATLATTAHATRARIAADAAVGRARDRAQETN